jgi:hypothetical protein
VPRDAAHHFRTGKQARDAIDYFREFLTQVAGVDVLVGTPATITPYGDRLPRRGSEAIVCIACDRCLTDAEREQLAETRRCLQYDETFPPGY